MYGYGYSPFTRVVSSSGGTPVDPDAQAFITAASITDPTQQSAINQLVTDLKGYGIWTKMKALYPFVGGTAAQHKWNLKDPRDLDAAFRLVFNGGWTHSSNGAKPNGINGYANTFLNPLNVLGLNNSALSIYSRTNNTPLGNDSVDIGANNNGQNILGIRNGVSKNTLIASIDASNFATSTNTDARGLFSVSKNNSTTYSTFKNGNLVASNSGAANRPNANIYIGVLNVSNNPYGASLTNQEYAFASISDGLSNTEVANFYTAVQTFQVTLGRSIGTQTVSDADAQAFVTNAGIVDQVEANAVNNLVIGLKADGLWSKMKAVYPFVGGTASSHKFNLKDPRDLDAAYRLVFNGGWTHSSTGATPNGTNGYADTKLNPFNNLILNNTHLATYSRTNNAIAAVDIGCTVSTSDAFGMANKWSDNNGYFNSYNLSTNRIIVSSVTSSNGLFSLSRTSNVSSKVYRNGSQIGSTNTTTQGNTSLPNKIIYFGSDNAATPIYYSNREYAFASIGDGLTDTDAANLYTRVQAFNTTLNRQV